nr:hypothetical protein [Lactobacillus iners]
MTPEQKEKHRLAQKRYMEKMKAQAQAGDEVAKKTIEREKQRCRLSSTLSYIKLHASMEDIKKIKKIIKSREKALTSDENSVII